MKSCGDSCMKKLHLAILTIPIFLMSIIPCNALERPDKEFKIFQFPADKIPCIDGNPSDWKVVPEEYCYGSNELSDTVKGHGVGPNKKDLDVKVKVGWVKGLNRLYFLYEAYDNYWNMTPSRGDIFEVVVDGDQSGGQFIKNDQLEGWENYFRFEGVHSQNYHIFTPPGEGRDWTMVWGCQPWIKYLPWANHAYSYHFKEGQSGKLILEFWITPFDYAPAEGPEHAVESKLEENKIIGLSWSVLDYDKNSSDYEGFWNLSHKTRMDSNASCQVAFRLMPLEKKFRKPIEAQWTFKIADMDRRLVAFKDDSYGKIDSWHWDFGDSTVSVEQNPIHEYKNPGEYIVTLDIKGPAGSARMLKVHDVAVR